MQEGTSPGLCDSGVPSPASHYPPAKPQTVLRGPLRPPATLVVLETSGLSPSPLGPCVAGSDPLGPLACWGFPGRSLLMLVLGAWQGRQPRSGRAGGLGLPDPQAKALRSLSDGAAGPSPARHLLFLPEARGPPLALTFSTWPRPGFPSPSPDSLMSPASCSPAAEGGPVLRPVALGCCVQRADGALSPRGENQHVVSST